MCHRTRALGLVLLLAASASPAGGQVYAPGDTAPSTAGKPHACDNFWPIGPSKPSARGDTVLSFRITAQGSVRDVTILRSSHDRFLDDAAQACVLTWQYKPATHRDGTPYEVSWMARVSWQLDPRFPDWPALQSINGSMTGRQKR